jgi:Helix-turn-helix
VDHAGEFLVDLVLDSAAGGYLGFNLLDDKRKRTGMTMADFARNVGKSTTAIYGMIRGDTTRFNAEALTDFLKRIGTTPEEWNRE